MEAKENRPDACAASGTANSIYKDFSTDAPDIQEELTGPVLPDDCAADIVSFCSEQTIVYDDLLEYATLFYLQDKDPEDPPFRDTLKFELLTLTNSCIDAYNFGKRDPNAAPGAKLKDAYPDKKEARSATSACRVSIPCRLPSSCTSCTMRWASFGTTRMTTATLTSAFTSTAATTRAATTLASRI